MAKILTNQSGIEAVKSSTDCGVRGEEVPGSGHIHGEIERLLVVLHVTARPFQRSERRMTFIEMAHLRLQP